MARPYSDYKVIDLTHVLAGPFATYQLAVLGADVIKVERPGQPDQVRQTGVEAEWGRCLMNTNFLTQGSNKRAITLDLQTEQGREVLLRLVETADMRSKTIAAGRWRGWASATRPRGSATPTSYIARSPAMARLARRQTIQPMMGWSRRSPA